MGLYKWKKSLLYIRFQLERKSQLIYSFSIRQLMWEYISGKKSTLFHDKMMDNYYLSIIQKIKLLLQSALFKQNADPTLKMVAVEVRQTKLLA